MPHDAQSPVPLSLNTPTGIDRLTDDELSAFREQFRALNESARSGLDDLADDCMPLTIGRFRILRRLGSGAFGCVYEAYDSRLSRKVAVKVSHLGVHTSQQTRSRFIHEAQAAARLAHPNVVCLHEYGEEQGLLYLVYEMCDGLTLEDWIVSQKAPVPVCTAVSIVRELAKGLSHAHLRGLVHRDVKPQNVLLTPNYDDQSRLPFIPRITDFGLAHNWTADSSKSLSARLVGTFATMSPEQARGDIRQVTPAADQYSLGIILYRLLTGHVPFEGDDVVRTLQRICNEHPRSVRSQRREVSRDLEAVVMTCLSKRPEARYATCKELARELERVLRGTPVAARPLRSYQRAWRLMCATPVVSTLSLAIFIGTLASAITFSMMASSLRLQRQELQRSVQDLTLSEAAAVRARQETEFALAAVTDQKLLAEQQRAQAVHQAYRADLHRAYEAWDEKQVLSTIDMLDRIQTSTDGFMEPCFGFRLLANQAQQSAKRLCYHDAPATEVCYISGSELVVSAGHNGELKFHDVHTGKLEFEAVPQANAAIDALAVSADGKFLAVGLNSPKMLSPSVRIYPLQLNDKEKQLGAAGSTFYATTTVESLRFSPCGRYLAIGQRYQPVLIHELATGNLLAAVPTDSRNRSVDFSADGELCLVVGEGNNLLLASSQTGHIQHKHTCPVNPQFACFSPLSGWIAYTAYEDPQVYLSYHSLADPESVGPSFVLTQQRGIVSSLDFSQDGRWLVAGTRRGGVVKWNLESLLTSVDSHQSADPINCVAEFVAHSGEVTDVCTVRGTHIVSVSNSGSVVLNPLPVLTVSRTGNDVTAALAMGTPADMHMLQGTSDGRVVLANLSTASNRELCGATHSPVTTIGRSPDGQRGAIGWGDGRIALVDLATQDLIPCDYAPPGDSLDERRINSLAFNHDGSMLAACGDDARLRIWSVADPSRNCWETTLTSFAYTTCFCGPQRVAVGGMFEDIWVYDLGSGQPAYRLPGSGRTVSLMFDHSRERLISGHADGRIRIHSGPQWQHVDTLNGDAGKINCLVGSPGWDCYISGDSQGQIKVWSAEHLELIGNLHTLADASSITSMELDQQRQELMVFFATRLPEGSAPESQCNYVRLNGR